MLAAFDRTVLLLAGLVVVGTLLDAGARAEPRERAVARAEAAQADPDLRPAVVRKRLRKLLKAVVLERYDEAMEERLEEAELVHRLGRRLEYGEVDRAVASAVMASALADSGDLATAFPLAKEAVEVFDPRAGHPWYVWHAFRNLDGALRRAGERTVRRQLLTVLSGAGPKWFADDSALELARILRDEGDIEAAFATLEAAERRLLASVDRHSRGSALDVMLEAAMMHSELGDPSRALEQYREVLEICDEEHSFKNSRTHREAQQGLVSVLVDLGRFDEAEQQLGSSLVRLEREARLEANAATRVDQRDVLDRWGSSTRMMLASTRNDLAYIYAQTARYDEAFQIWTRARGGSRDVRLTLNLAALFLDMGEITRAQTELERLVEELDSEQPLAVAHALSALANVRAAQGRPEDEWVLRNEAIRLFRNEPGNELNVARQLANRAVLEGLSGQHDAARLTFDEALEIRERILGPSHPDVVATLARAASNDIARGDLELAQQRLDRVWVVGWASDRVFVRRQVLRAIGGLMEAQGDLDAAIFMRKMEVELLQAARQRVLSSERYAAANAATYRELADLLVRRGRLAEAERVLALLKAEEYAAYVRRDAPPASSGAPLTTTEEDWRDRFDRIRDRVISLGEEQATLRGKRGLSTAEQERLSSLKDDLVSARRTMAADLRTLREEFATQGTERSLQLGRADLDSLGAQQGALARLGDGVVLLHYFVTEARLWVLVTTPNAQVKREVQVTSEELNRLVADFRAQLRNPGSDPRSAGQALHELLIAPIAEDLDQADAQTLMCFLDGTLRYIPFAALFDGERYLAQDYATSVYTPAARASLEAPALEGAFRIGAVGVSKASTVGQRRFDALPAVREELEALVREEGDGPGIAEGVVLLDERFTEEAFGEVLAGDYAVVHVASHFALTPGSDEDSFLLLGKGGHLSLADLKYGDFEFADVDLLTLSACETGLDDGANGAALEGFGTLAQNRGARAVMATLWSVADASTARFMEQFYTRRSEGLDKAEALRLAQQSFIEDGGRPGDDQNRGFSMETATGSGELGWRHPYYWAPFVLMGNWR